jgi:alpha-galactosidase
MYSLFQLYAQLGVDFVKVDDIAASRLYHFHAGEIELIREAIDQCGRDIVLSLSPGPAPLENADFLKKHANMWRLTDDYWDHWKMLYEMFERCEKWYSHVEPGHGQTVTCFL